MSKKKLQGLEPESSIPEITRPIQVKKTPPVEEPDNLLPAEPAVLPVSEPESERVGKNKGRAKWILLGILGMFLIGAIGAGIGYSSAIAARVSEDKARRQLAAATQFELGIQNQKDGQLEIARKRFEYVLTIYPEYPGIEEKLVEIGLLIAQNQGGTALVTPQPLGTPVAGVTPVPTRDTKSVSILLEQGNKQYAAQDWTGLFVTVNSLRDIDPSYEPVQVDGLLYAAMRNMGIYEIQSGRLEVGLYDFAVAEGLAPIDLDAESYRTWARMYLTAGSWWGLNWLNAMDQFAQLHAMVPNLRDSSGYTVTQRYSGSLAGYAHYLQLNYDWCGAVPYYEKAAQIYSSSGLPEKISEAYQLCQNPPPTPTPTIDPYAPTPTPTKKPKKN